MKDLPARAEVSDYLRFLLSLFRGLSTLPKHCIFAEVVTLECEKLMLAQIRFSLAAFSYN